MAGFAALLTRNHATRHLKILNHHYHATVLFMAGFAALLARHIGTTDLYDINSFATIMIPPNAQL